MANLDKSAIKAIEDGWFQRQIADSAYDQAVRKARGERTVIGVNKYVEDDENVEIETHPYDPQTERSQIDNLRRTRQQRDNNKIASLLAELKLVAQDESQNIMPITIELVKAQASMGDIVECLREIWGTYREMPVF